MMPVEAILELHSDRNQERKDCVHVQREWEMDFHVALFVLRKST
jgi:hypothetical protein